MNDAERAYEYIRSLGARGFPAQKRMLLEFSVQSPDVFLMTMEDLGFCDLAESDEGRIFSIHDYHLIEKSLI